MAHYYVEYYTCRPHNNRLVNNVNTTQDKTRFADPEHLLGIGRWFSLHRSTDDDKLLIRLHIVLVIINEHFNILLK